MNWLGWLGRLFIGPLDYVIDFTVFFLQALAVWRPHRNIINRAVYSAILGQLIFTGVDAVAMISFLAVVVGIGVTSQLIYIMQAITGAGEITEILARLLLSELGPLITAVILIGRSCSAMAVDLGNTKVHGEIQSLEYLGIDVDDYFVVPRILSMAISQVVLALYFSIIMLICGVFFSAAIYHFSATKSLTELINTMSYNVLGVFFLKNICFGLVIGAQACFHGLSVSISPTQVPQEMQKAVVRSLLFVSLIDGYFILLSL